MSLSSSHQPSGLGPTTFPLSKFSFATVSGELIKPIPWTHISDKGHLFAVFEQTRSSSNGYEKGERSQFKVLADPEVLEDVDLKVLAYEASKAVQDMKTSLWRPKFPAVTIIVQEPCIAVRFPLPYDQIRRFQIKFKLQSDFYKALSFFSQAGCPLTQAGTLVPPVHAGRPSMDSSSGPPGYPRSGSQDNRPQSTGDPATRAHVAGFGLSIASSGRPSTSSDCSSRSVLPTSSCSSHPCNVSSSQPSDMRDAPLFSRSSDLQLASNHTVGQSQEHNAAQVELSRHLTSASPSEPAQGIVNPPVTIIDNPESAGLHQAIDRPSTAPTTNYEDLSRMLPPRRELPFKLPKTASATGAKSPDFRAAYHTTQGNNTGVDVCQHTSNPLDWPVQQPRHQHTRVSPNAAVETGSRSGRSNRKVACRSGTRYSTTERTGTPIQPFRMSNEVYDEARDHVGLAEKNMGEGAVASRYSSTDQLVDRAMVDAASPSNPVEEASADTTSRLLPADRCINIEYETPPPCVYEREQRASKRKAPHVQSSALPPSKQLHLDTSDKIASAAVQDQEERPRTRGLEAGKANEHSRIPLADISNTCQPNGGHDLARSSLVALLNDPDFAKIPESTQWANLPRENRETILQTWICRQLDSDSFVTLVSDLEGMWQRVFLGI